MAANTCTKVFISLFSGILSLLFVALLGIGIYVVVTFKGAIVVDAIIISVSVVGCVLSVFGFCGARFKPDGTGRFAPCLVIFFVGVIAICIVFVLLGAACFFVKPTLQYIMVISVDQILQMFSGLTDEQINNIQSLLEKLKGSMTLVGVFCFIIAVVAGFMILVTSYHMGKRLFSKFFVSAGSLIMFLLGVAGIAISAMLYSNKKLFSVQIDFTVTSFAILLSASIILILIAALGIVVGCCGEGKKCLILFYVIGVSIVFVLFVIVGIVGIAFRSLTDKVIDSMCPAGDQSCQTMLDLLRENTCKHIADERERNKCKDELSMKDVLNIFKDMFAGWLRLIAVVGFIVAVFLLFVLIASCCACTKDQQRREELSSGIPDYRKHTDVAY